MIRRLIFLLAAASLPIIATASEIEETSLEAELSYGHATQSNVAVQELLEVVPGLVLSFDGGVSFHASARLRLDAQDLLEPGRAAEANYANASRPVQVGTAGTAELRDFYVEVRSGDGLMRFGKQQIVWGRLDGIKVLDVLNPQDYREFILDDFSDSRISLWSAYFDYPIGDWRIELALIPDASGHAIPTSDAWFELTAPRFRFGAETNEPGLPTVTVRPGHSIEESGAGLRVSHQFNTTELAFVAFTGKDPEPLGRLRAIDGVTVVEQFNKRRDVFGVSLDMGLGAAVIRAEYAHHPQREFNRRFAGRLETVALDQHRAAIGIDVDGPSGVFINAQYLIDHVSEAPQDLVRPKRDELATLYLRRSFAYDSIILAARWYYSIEDDDHLASVSFAYSLNDSTTIELQAERFSGISEGLFGQFEDRDRVVLSLRHTF